MAKPTAKKKTGKKTGALIKEQLMDERAFLYYCNSNYLGNGEKRLSITHEFLEAAEQDELVTSLLEETVADGDSTVKVKYYSPHQLFFMAGLHTNVLKDGRISSERQMAWGPGEYRTILWGKSLGITVDAATGKPLGNLPNQLDIHGIAKHFDNFLRLIHSQPQYHEYESALPDRRRHFTMAPNVRFNLKKLEQDGETLLRAHKLTVKDLALLRYCIGSLAAQIDPLEYWYDYLKRHPYWRKDKLKDAALLAHELYTIEQIVADTLAAASGAPQPPLMEFLHEGSKFKPYLMSEVTYAGGTDIKALQNCITEVRKWIAIPANTKLVPDDSVAALDTAETLVKEFVQFYGDDRSYISGVPRTVEPESMPIEDLDPITRGYAEDMIKRLKPDDPDYNVECQMEIGEAIHTRLTFLRHDIWGAIDGIGAGVRRERDAAWRTYEDSQRWVKPEEDQKKLFLEAKGWDEKVDDFSKNLKDYSLVYCQECREKPVQLHYDNGDQQVSHDPICDDCFKQVAEGALGAKQPIKGGEWRCDYCIDPKSGEPPMLYRFAQRNIVSLRTVNDTPVKIQLDYGRATLEAKCKNCHTVQRREIDWGWTA